MTHRRPLPGLVGLLGLTALATAGLPSHAAETSLHAEPAPIGAAQVLPDASAPALHDLQILGPDISLHRQGPDEASLGLGALPRTPHVPAQVDRQDLTEASPAGSGSPAPGRDTGSAAPCLAPLRSGATAPRFADASAATGHSLLLPVRHGQQHRRPTETLVPAAFTTRNAEAATLAEWRDPAPLPVALASQTNARLATATPARHTPLIPLGAALLLAAGLVLAVQQALSRRALAPLAEIRTRLAKLADGDFTAQAQSITTRGDIADMHRALDQLSLDGRRRLAMQAELARLGDRVVAANRQMTAELEAAARVQRAQLPAAPCGFQGGTFHAFFRPSRVVAGDTYDCLSLPDGRTRVFQIDVSGHGAPAALVSIASHIALKQAMLSAPPTEALAAIIARTNRDWAEDLPYFTLLAVEIDPATATASIVQCGHPALLRLPATGGVEALGEGGLPIGVLPDATFSTLTCPFHPGDRLVLVTDGVTETADPDAQMFGDDRLRALLVPARKGSAAPVPVPRLFDRIERALWDWRGSESLEDDITILVLEAT